MVREFSIQFSVYAKNSEHGNTNDWRQKKTFQHVILKKWEYKQYPINYTYQPKPQRAITHHWNNSINEILFYERDFMLISKFLHFFVSWFYQGALYCRGGVCFKLRRLFFYCWYLVWLEFRFFIFFWLFLFWSDCYFCI